MSNVRRVFYYMVSLISLGITAWGTGGLLALLFDMAWAGQTTIGQESFNRQQFSLSLAMLVIGVPLWFLFWRSIGRYVRNYPAEIGAAMRQLYLNFILTVSLLTAVIAAQECLTWLFSGMPSTQNISSSLATMISAGAIWIYHWLVAEKEGHPSEIAGTLRRWYIYIVSGWGLVVFSVAVVQMINSLVRYLPVWGNYLITGDGWTIALAGSLAALLPAGAVWIFHWFRMARGDSDSTLRQVYLYLLAVAGSAIAGLSALIVGLYYTLVWAMGGAAADNAGYFQYLGWVIPTLVVCAGIWFYHQAIVREESSEVKERQASSRRIHLYLMSFIGLGALTYGISALLGVILNLIINGLSPAFAESSGWWQRQLSLGLALILAAAPLWLYYWKKLLELADRGGIMEWKATSRRIYLYIIIGAAIITLAADLVNLVYRILSGALGGSWGVEVLLKSRWSIQTLIPVAPILIYHWQIARQDQRRGAEAAARRKMVTALIDLTARPLIARLEEKLGTRIRMLEYTGTGSAPVELTETELDEIAVLVRASPTAQVMLVAVEGKVRVLPYKEIK